MQSYKDLIVWQKAKFLALEIYRLTSQFPSSEMYGLTSQMRRCAVSIPSNIAEGSRRSSRKDFRQFVIIAYGSGSELETQLGIAKDLSMGNASDYTSIEKLMDEVMRMLNALQSKLQS
jgi:four helix bundle protein